MSSTALSAETRARVLEAAWERVLAHGPGGASVKDIAAAAGVSRQLVYFHYGEPRRPADRDGPPPRRGERRSRAPSPPAGRSRSLLRAWCDYVPEILPVARALEAALVTGDEGGSAWRDRMAELRAIFARAVADLDLADGWTRDRAADWIWAASSPRPTPTSSANAAGRTRDFTERTVDRAAPRSSCA